MLEKFRSRVVEIQEGFQRDIPWVYRMDGDGNKIPCMMTHAGLVRCNCCDYFLFFNGEIILIEVTDLMAWKRDRDRTYKDMGMDEESADSFVWKLARQENRLKVFGSMLTLCRYAKKCTKTAEMTSVEKYQFWLVVSDAANQITMKSLQRFKIDLRSGLAGSFSTEMLTEVAVLDPREFQSRFQASRTYF